MKNSSQWLKGIKATFSDAVFWVLVALAVATHVLFGWLGLGVLP